MFHGLVIFLRFVSRTGPNPELEDDPEPSYSLPPGEPGEALVLHCADGDDQHAKLLGYGHDVKSLRRLLQDQLGYNFTAEPMSGRSPEEVLALVQSAIRRCNDTSLGEAAKSFLLIILSHGVVKDRKQEVFIGPGQPYVNFDDFVDKICQDEEIRTRKIPKVVIAHLCRTPHQYNVAGGPAPKPDDHFTPPAPEENLLVAYSCAEGKPSYVSTKPGKGSVYVEKLCQVMETRLRGRGRRANLLTSLLEVNGAVTEMTFLATKRAQGGREKSQRNRQCPGFHCYLKKSMIYRPKPSQ